MNSLAINSPAMNPLAQHPVPGPDPARRTMLAVEGLKTWFFTRDGVAQAVDDVSFSVSAGETLAIVGESGCGKSMTALSIMQLVASPPGKVVGGSVRVAGRELLGLDAKAMRGVRGNDVSMIFQEPMTSLNPVVSVGDQIAETVLLHTGLGRREADARAVEMLRLVKIPEPERRAREYPHQLSGGMRQRVMIAMALACNPKVLLADEPTTALDVTIQAQVLELVRELQDRLGTAVVLITHDLGVVAETAQRVIVMYAGRTVEECAVRDLFAEPLHPYTRGLLASVPHLTSLAGEASARLQEIPGTVPGLTSLPQGCAFGPRCPHATDICRAEIPPFEEKRSGHKAACWHSDTLALARPAPPAAAEPRVAPPASPTRAGAVPVLEVSGLTKVYPAGRNLFGRARGHVRAVDGVSFTIGPGETLGLVGESGCGKSTAARAVMRLVEPSGGEIKLAGQSIMGLSRRAMRPLRRQMQMVFQDPFASLDPRMTAGAVVEQPLKLHGIGGDAAGRRKIVLGLFDRVGLRRAQIDNLPHQFSGGQRQRIGIARALALGPKLIVADEPVSALDVSIQAQVINLLMDLQGEMGLSYLFIAHDLAVVEHISHRVAVMYLGKVVEYADKRSLFASPLHPYTEALLAAVPVPDPQVSRERRLLVGDVPSPIDPPPGCPFQTRCPHVMPRCLAEAPPYLEVRPGHFAACHLRQPEPSLTR